MNGRSRIENLAPVEGGSSDEKLFKLYMFRVFCEWPSKQM